MKKNRNSSLAPLPLPGPKGSNFKSARHSSQIEPSKKYNQYMAPQNEYGSANNGFHQKKRSMAPSGKPPSEADASSSKNLMTFEDRMQKAVMGKYFIKNPDQVASLRVSKQKLGEKQVQDLKKEIDEYMEKIKKVE